MLYNKNRDKIMNRDEVFLKLSKEAEILQKKGFDLVEGYVDAKLAANVYEKVTDSKRFIFRIVCQGRFIYVTSKIGFNHSVWENEIRCQLNNYEDIEDDIKELINSTIKLSTL